MAWIEAGEIVEERHGESDQTTHNRMELRAPNGEKKDWKKKGGEIKNIELVQELLTLYRVQQWIAAHSGNLWNEYADSLATAWNRSTL
ncbi:MAG: hypothetical protein JKY61_08030 [Planctomycetes bacterium]|nr:hypothetical protein [Planctomycetota bacterium]